MKRLAVAGFLLVLAAALFLRCGALGQRPLHNDEAINAFKVWQLWDRGEFRYDPEEYHGPALYYGSLPVMALAAWWTGRPPDGVAMRSVALVFGIALLLVLLLAVDGLGWGVILGAALWTAVSPAFVYYSRYYIHEVPLVFFTALTLAALWRYSRRPSFFWAGLAGAGLALMYATKETFVFAVAAALPAWLISVWAGVRREQGGGRVGLSVLVSSAGGLLRAVPRGHWVAAAGCGGAVWLMLFTSFFTNASGPWDALRTYLIWLERAGGASPHIHPWTFYWQRLGWFHLRGGPVWTEAWILGLAVTGGLAVVVSRRLNPEQHRVGWFLLGYSLLLSLAYAVIPYKTPWCLLGFYHGYILLAGVGAWYWVTLSSRLWVRVVLVAVGLVGAGHLAVQSGRANGEFAADYRNPLVYGHTAGDVVNLLEQVEAITRVSGEGRQMAIQVMAPGSGYWPLPWYWRHYERAGWWDRVPENPWSPVIVSAVALKAGLEERSNRAWLQVGMFELRPRFFVEVYVEAGLWKRFLAARAAER
ncbi:MAG: TIGR03663 family protein [Verrucomicrobiales bacterium]|nr:TIGR03663 family protein [Verrucomicrobiales bacterium]